MARTCTCTALPPRGTCCRSYTTSSCITLLTQRCAVLAGDRAPRRVRAHRALGARGACDTTASTRSADTEEVRNKASARQGKCLSSGRQAHQGRHRCLRTRRCKRCSCWTRPLRTSPHGTPRTQPRCARRRRAADPPGRLRRRCRRWPRSKACTGSHHTPSTLWHLRAPPRAPARTHRTWASERRRHSGRGRRSCSPGSVHCGACGTPGGKWRSRWR